METATKSPPRGRSRVWRKLVISLSSALVLLVLVEGGARVAGWALNGFNPWYLRYGIDIATDEHGEGHTDRHPGYSKFPPSRWIRYGVPEPARINAFGFRGEDFEPSKPVGVQRVVCMGASSTFGFKNRDAGTYPHLLQQQFGPDGTGAARVEVINAGIPHAESDNLLAMFEREIVGYQPDVVTIYEGYNDAIFPMAQSRLEACIRWLDRYSAAYAAVRKLGVSALKKSNWWRYPKRTTPEHLATQRALHVRRFRSNLTRILDLASERGIDVVLVRQATTLRYHRERAGLPFDATASYAQQCRQAEAALAAEGTITDFEAHLLIHRDLMDVLDQLAAERGLPVVDNIALVDLRPEGLLTPVHLDEEANGRLAQALHVILAPLLRARTRRVEPAAAR